MRFHLRTIQNCLLEGRDREGLSYLENMIGRIEAGKHRTPDVGNQMVNAVLEGELAQMPEEMTLECQGALRPICRRRISISVPFHEPDIKRAGGL